MTKATLPIDLPQGGYTPNRNPWRFGWPNSADQNFNFYKLLDEAADTGIAGFADTGNPRVAVIGAGISGLTVASELFRSGVANIDIFESTDRIGGRDYSAPVPGRSTISETIYELGAMRFPFFTDPTVPNAVMKFYADAYGITTQPFPDPGKVQTGIYINNGYGPDPMVPLEKPTLLIWNPSDGHPPTETLQDIYARWGAFSTMIQTVFEPVYVTSDADWTSLWHAVADHYANLNFRQMAQLPVLQAYDPSHPGYFGGLGFSDQELQIFYLIGAGDGSWGAFFDVSALYIFRTLMCGFGTNHQLIRGRYNGATFNPGPHYSNDPEATVPVSGGSVIKAPIYRGIQSFSECALFLPQSPRNKSLYDAIAGEVPDANVRLFASTDVIELADTSDPQGSGAITVSHVQKQPSRGPVAEDYDIVVLTPTTWATQTSIRLQDLSTNRLPYTMRNAMKTEHWIKSCKVCFALARNYWAGESPVLPQVLITDSMLQDAYAYTSGDDPLGVVVLSYTWEDDASKFLSNTDEELIALCLNEADRITGQTVGVKLSDYLDLTTGRVIHWALAPSYHGCAKLYREGRWAENYELLAFNEKRARGLFLAGESASVEGGWTEGALRIALDAVVNIVESTPGAGFHQLDYGADYLQLDTGFLPAPLNPFGA